MNSRIVQLVPLGAPLDRRFLALHEDGALSAVEVCQHFDFEAKRDEYIAFVTPAVIR